MNSNLHHINQNGEGKLVEASGYIHKKYHDALHSVWGKNRPHPHNPVNRSKFDTDRESYWKWRAENVGK